MMTNHHDIEPSPVKRLVFLSLSMVIKTQLTDFTESIRLSFNDFCNKLKVLGTIKDRFLSSLLVGQRHKYRLK